MPDVPPPLTRAEAAELLRRRRGRNLVLLAVLLGVALLFYAIAVVKMTGPQGAQ